jgi:hypothetical protein
VGWNEVGQGDVGDAGYHNGLLLRRGLNDHHGRSSLDL